MNVRILKWSTMFVLLLVGTLVVAQGREEQPDSRKKERKERLQALKVKHITKKLNLSEEESPEFWTIYNKYDEYIRQDRKSLDRKPLETLTEREAQAFIQDRFKYEEQKLIYKQRMTEELATVIGYKRVALLHKAEKSFKKKVLKKHKKRQKAKNK